MRFLVKRKYPSIHKGYIQHGSFFCKDILNLLLVFVSARLVDLVRATLIFKVVRLKEIVKHLENFFSLGHKDMYVYISPFN